MVKKCKCVFWRNLGAFLSINSNLLVVIGNCHNLSVVRKTTLRKRERERMAEANKITYRQPKTELFIHIYKSSLYTLTVNITAPEKKTNKTKETAQTRDASITLTTKWLLKKLPGTLLHNSATLSANHKRARNSTEQPAAKLPGSTLVRESWRSSLNQLCGWLNKSVLSFIERRELLG